MRNLRDLIRQHVNHWFRRVGRDDWSPALTVQAFNDRFLEFLKHKKLSLCVSELFFRRAMAELLCTMYVAQKQGTTWRGPLSAKVRPQGWTQEHEAEWEEYWNMVLFSDDVWHGFWYTIPETSWESRVPDWRMYFQLTVSHYVRVDPSKIDFKQEDSSSISSEEED